jgi:hypothetical protein
MGDQAGRRHSPPICLLDQALDAIRIVCVE